jgi:predicted ester cyclase
MSEQENVRIATEYLEAWNSRDYDRLRTYHGDSFSSLLPGVSGPVGEVGHRASMEATWAAFPDLTFEITRIIAQGDYVVVNWIGTGTHTGPMATPTGGAIPPTGRKGIIPGSDTLEIRDGKVVGTEVYYDRASLLGQLGLMPQG